MDSKDRSNTHPHPLNKIAATTTSGASPTAQKAPLDDSSSSTFQSAMISRSFMYFQFLIGLVVCRLFSTGIEFDEGSKDNGYLVYTSRIILPDETTKVYGLADHLFSLATQAYKDMTHDCQKRGFAESECPKAMSVFAHGRELHFGSSVKRYRRPDVPDVQNHEFFYGFLATTITPGSTSKAGTLDRLQTAMLQCQMASRESLDPYQHNYRGQCGEFTSVFTYLLSKPDPKNVDLRGSRVVTVGRNNGQDLGLDPVYRPACVRGKNPAPATYGCSNWVKKLGIWSPLAVLGLLDEPDPGSRINRVELCDLYGDDDWTGPDETGSS
jgi:hypothetical protein